MQKTNKNFFWPIADDQTREQLELFINLSIVRGVHHCEVLAEMVKSYNERFLDENPSLRGVSLIGERGLIKRMRDAGTPVHRVALVRHRGSKSFSLGAVPLFWTDGRRVVYNLEGCGEFFRQKQSKAA